MTASPSVERLSTLIGLLVVMAATLPRYLAGGHQARLTLILIAAGAVALAAVFYWRMLERPARRALPSLLRRLSSRLLVGVLAIGGWQVLFEGGIDVALMASHGAALGLLLHVIGLWRKPESRE